MPKVSIGIPVYNGGDYIGPALEGMINQTFKDLEIVICDNCSTDNTPEIVQAIAAKDPRVKYHRNETNLGAAPNYNRVFELSTGEYFCWAAHDDVYAPEFIEKCVKTLDEDPGVSLAYSLIGMWDDEDNPMIHNQETDKYDSVLGYSVMGPDDLHIAEQPGAHVRFRNVLLRVCWCMQVFGLARREQMLKTGLQRSYYGADKVYLAELALMGRWNQIDEVLFYKRVHRKMSFFRSVKEKSKWIDANGTKSMPQVQMARDYVSMVMASDMTLTQKIHCINTIPLMIAKRDGVLKRLFVPGRDNYFGIDFGMGRKKSEA